MANSSESLTGLLRASGLSGGDSLNTHMTSLSDQLQQQQSINDALMQQTLVAMVQAGERRRSIGRRFDSGRDRRCARGCVGRRACLAPLISGYRGTVRRERFEHSGDIAHLHGASTYQLKCWLQRRWRGTIRSGFSARRGAESGDEFAFVADHGAGTGDG